LEGRTVSADTDRTGRHRQALAGMPRAQVRRRRWTSVALALVAIVGVTATIVLFAVHDIKDPTQAGPPAPLSALPSASADGSAILPTSPDSYIGLYTSDAPHSYAGVRSFTSATGVKPSVVVYYSGWMESFQESFARVVASNGAVPLVQLDPNNISIRAIASGKYDAYLSAYAKAVHSYRRPVILSFGHEMNGYWYSWGNLHTPAAIFVAAWRHIVTLFRALGARNVTWMWTINTIHPHAKVPPPGQWWPGSSYVTWVGIDGYYFNPSSTFAPLFGPTVTAVRKLTRDPILISETGAPPSASQSAKVADLFAGVHLYGLLGFVWFDADDTAQNLNWLLSGSASFAAFRRGVETSHRYSP
jgi:mannan endo-1,4-beta-mannosidase